MKSVTAIVAAFAISTMPTPGLAQDNSSTTPSVPDAVDAPICTDRPTRSSSVCTVPAGAVQIESDLGNWTRNSDSGVRTDTILYVNPTLKYGLGARTDLQLNIAPYVTVHSKSEGVTDKTGGVGDLYVRLKQQLTDGTGKVQAAIIPYVKAPTAKLGIGNDTWEGGAVAPVVFSLPSGWSLNFSPELDILSDSDGSGHHVQAIGTANLSRTFGKATVYAELWTAQNFDPAGTAHQYSADAAIAYLITPRWQIDLGANFGLNRFTPDTQAYLGLSTRF
jgi:hypothetical protein